MYRRTFLFGVASAAVAACAVTRKTALAAEARLVCRAFLERASVPYDGEITLTALLESMQEGCALFVPLTWGFRGLQVSVTDASGAQTLPPINNFHPPPPQELSRPESFVRMYKGMLVGETLRQRASDFFPKRGAFTVRVSYLSPVPKAYTSIANAIVEEDGSFAAAPISVTVT
jgi:hypothetical protein